MITNVVGTGQALLSITALNTFVQNNLINNAQGVTGIYISWIGGNLQNKTKTTIKQTNNQFLAGDANQTAVITGNVIRNVNITLGNYLMLISNALPYPNVVFSDNLINNIYSTSCADTDFFLILIAANDLIYYNSILFLFPFSILPVPFFIC